MKGFIIMNRVDILLATYNGEKYLKQCIDSVLNQTYDNFEYIIADHGSTDSTWKIVEEYSKKDNRYQWKGECFYNNEENTILYDGY